MSQPKNQKTNSQASYKNKAEKLAHQLEIIQDVTQRVAADQKPENVLGAALQHLTRTLAYDAAQIYRLSSTRKDLWLHLELGCGNKPVTQDVGLFSIEGNNIVSHAVRNEAPIYIPDINQSPYSPYGQRDADEGIKSELALPLKSARSLLGVLRLQSCRLDAFSHEDVSFLTSLAGLLSYVIKNTETVEQLRNNLREIDVSHLPQEGSNQSPGHPLQSKSMGYHQPSYQYDYRHVTAVEPEELPPAIKLAIKKPSGEVNTSQTERGQTLVAPIKLYGEMIGILGAEDGLERDGWSPDDIKLIEEISSQVALAIENARLLKQTQERTQELALLFDTSRQLSETIDLSQIYEIAATQIVDCLNADTCSVLLLNKARTHFDEIITEADESLYQGREAVSYTKARPEPIEDSPTLQQILKQPELIIEFPDSLPAGDEVGQKLKSSGNSRQRRETDISDVDTVTSFPLLVRNNLVGLLRATHLAKRHEYTQNELQLAKAIVSQATVAIENAQLFEQTESALSETQKLYEISRSLVESNSLEETFGIILGSAKAYDIDRVSISLIEQNQAGRIDKVTIAASWDRDSDMDLPVGSEISTEMFPLVEAFAQPPFLPLISEDLRRTEGQDERMDEAFRKLMYEQLGAVTLFSAPLFLGMEYKGVLSISTRSPHSYSQQERRIYQTLADQAIIAIERHRLLEATRQERDRAALLYDFGQKLSQTNTIEEVSAVVLSFTNEIGAVHGEIYISDGQDFFTMGSTMPERQALSTDQAEELVRTVLSRGTEARALKSKKIVSKNLQVEDWYIDEVPITHKIQSLIAIPFYSQRSDLQGTLSWFHSTAEAFSQEHIQLFESMAIQTVAALENAWLLLQTATALSDTELLFRATRDFNTCQRIEDSLTVLVKNFAYQGQQPERSASIQAHITHMSIGLITALEEDGSPKSLEIVSHWNRQETGGLGQIAVAAPNIKISSDQHPFLNQMSPDTLYNFDAEAKTFMDEYLGKARSAISIPLRVGNNWLGVLFVASIADKVISKQSVVEQITTLAGQVAVVIQNLQLVEETQQNLFNSEILSHLSQELLTADTAEAIYNLSLDAIAATDPSRGAAIFAYVHTERGVEFEIVAIWDNPNQTWPAVLPGTRFSAEDLGLQPLLKTGQTVTSGDIVQDPNFSETLRQLLNLMQIASLVAVPIWLNKEVNGFVLIGHKSPTETFASDTIWLYENIGRLTSGALENRRLFEEARHRAAQLQTAAEVSQAATSHMELETLLAQSANLIRDRFGFYHVSIFLVDEYQKYAVVEASTGEVGQRMLATKHRLAVGGRSIVGSATATGKPRIALDVGKDAIHFNNPLLPDTRSEMALPLTARGRVIGALDVQSSNPNAFTDNDITILQSMANQLANAIEAARYYQQANKALEDMGKLQEQYLRREWAAYLKEQQARLGYRLTKEGFQAFEDISQTPATHLALIGQAVEEKRPLVRSSQSASSSIEALDGTAPPDEALDGQATATLVAPLTVNEQVAIGAVDFEALSEAIEDPDTLRIIESVTTQAAQAIEAVRQFEQTQVAREEAETLYKVGNSLVTAETEEEMFHTVLKDMLSTLGLNQGGVLFIEEDRRFGKLVALFKGGQPSEPNLRIPIAGNPSYEKLIATKQPVAIPDFATDPLVAPVRTINPEHTIASLLLVPIIIGDEVIGAIGADAVTKKHDFTEREINLVKAIADQLSITLQNRRLLEETRQRALELQETAERLQEMDKLKTQFLANMSHELRTPLNSIIGFSRVILKGIDGPLTELQKTDLTSIYNSGQHLLGLINNVLDLSKIEAGKMELNFEEVEIGPVIKGVMSTAIALVKDKPVELRQEIPENLPTVWADATRLRQIVLNLVSNACKFTEEGTVNVKATAQKEKIIISVSDTGMGIPSHNLEHIFEEFTQVDASTTRKVGGTGLGLPISRHFVEMHRGQIWVNSSPNKGSTFSFAIPIKPSSEQLEAVDDTLSTNGSDGQGRTVVAIDDDPGVINLYRRFLEKRDYRIVDVDNNADVVAQVKAHIPFAILLDILMPNKDGWKILKELKRDALTKDIPVIVCSIIGDKNKGFELGAADYLTKPIVESELVSALKHVDEQQKEQLKVLVIDDQADDILLIRRMLEAHNYQIIEANNGKEGLNLARTRTPNLIILDLSMPEMDGFAVIDAVKNDERTEDIPIVIVSAKEPTQAQHKLLSGQVEVLLHKGIFTENELLEVVGHALERSVAHTDSWSIG